MILRDLHVHTTYCDGKNTPEEMVRAALDLNMKTLGFSVHGYTDFDESYCIPKEKVVEYKAEIKALKEKYRNKIEILCGVELDYYSDEVATEEYEYSIGSVHYVKCGDEYFPIDLNAEVFKSTVGEFSNGDYIAYAERYFKNVADVIKKTKADIIGHFDLVAKYNEGNKFFDENDARYVNAGFAAIDALIETGKPFEINSGAISRGYKTTFYPSEIFLQRIAQKGGKVILSSDSHNANTLCFKFEEAERMARDMGLEIV